MPQTDDKLIALTQTGILSKSNPSSVALRVVIITNNPSKYEEFRSQLGDGYGMDVHQWKIDTADQLDEAALVELCKTIMKQQPFSPHFILREETSLRSQKGNKEELTHLPLVELAKRKLEPVLHTSTLNVFKPQWASSEGATEKELTGLSLRIYEKRAYGYITREKKNLICEHGFGWDSLFVNAATNLSNEQFFKLYGKKSARQHTVSDFIDTYLRYKALITLKHHNLPITRPIDFGHNFFHLARFVQQEKYLSNPHIADWGIQKLRNAMINEGLFIKAAWSRPVKNYFSPPFSGLPLTAKKDDAEETIFMTHDTLHHLICDLICDVEPSPGHFYVYSAWRMTSEACTLVLADMFYADGLIKSGVARSCVDSRIYPLFECIKKTQGIGDPKTLNNDDKIAFIRKLLYANVVYALLGDDREWKALLASDDDRVNAENLRCLAAYKNHFGKFFIGDNAWTRANYDNMHKNHEPLKKWINHIGKQTFRDSNIPLLSDITSEVADNNHSGGMNYQQVIDGVFNVVFARKIQPHLAKDHVVLGDEESLQSRAFRRFLIGQASLLTRYPTPLNLEFIFDEIFARLKDNAPFSADEQDELRSKLEQYIRGLEGLRLMSMDESNNAIDCSPVFPPVYIAYPKMQEQYGTIANCVKQCIESYGQPQKKAAASEELHGEKRNILFAEAHTPPTKNPAPTAAAAVSNPH